METTPSQYSIVHVVAPARFGGLESVVETLAGGQAASGDSVCVVAVLSRADPLPHPFLDAVERRGVDLVDLRVGARSYLRERREVGEILRRRAAHVLHTHGYRPDVVDGPLGRAMGIATVTTVHGYTWGGGPKASLYEWLQKRSHRRFDAVIAVSAKLRSELVGAGLSAERVHTLPNAWAAARPPLSRAEARLALGIDAHETVFGWVGRMSREKAPDVAVRALAATRDPKVGLSMVGTGPLMDASRALATSLGLEGRVRWHGYVADVGRHLGAFDGLLLTSWTEGTPVTLLEAMAASVPIVTTRVGGIPDVVGPEEASFASAGDVTALARALDQIVSDPTGAANRAVAAKRRLDSSFAIEPWVSKHRAIYRTAMNIA